MNRIAWQGLLPPAALPFVVSLAVALAGPGGLLGLSADPAGEPTPYIADSSFGEDGPSGQDDSLPTPTAIASLEPSATPESTSVATPTPAPAIAAVPPGTAPPATQAPPPPAATASPAPTPPAPTASPVPPIDDVEACTLATAYAQGEIASVTLQVKSCMAKQITGGWEVTVRIRHPGCAALDAQGLPCASSPLKLTFFVSDADRTVVAADAETALILDTY